MKNAFIITLGCRLNHADTALLTARLQKAGYQICDGKNPDVDLVVLNSCAITAEAEKKSRQQLRRLKRLYPAAQIAVTGCAAELDEQAMRASGADFVWSNPDKKELFADCCGKKSIEIAAEPFVEKSMSEFPFRTRAFIKVQEGCDNHCSYCIVPAVRGVSRSRDFAECIADCRHALECGFPELVLTGVNTCDYRDGSRRLPELLHEIAALPGEFRIRLGSTEPHPSDLLLPEIIAAAGEKFCRFLHLSMQHGSDRILRAMNRRYTAAEFVRMVQDIRRQIPDIHIGTDFIVGFPGETDEDFAGLMEVVSEVGFANIHAFAYSVRPGTPAASMPDQVDKNTVRQRMQMLKHAAGISAENFRRSQLGKILPVIFEREHRGVLRGWSDNYLAVCAAPGEFPYGKIVNVLADEKKLAKDLQSDADGTIL